MHLLRKRKGRDQTMRKKITKQCIGTILAGMVLATFPVSLAVASMTSSMEDTPQYVQTISLKIKELAGQGIGLEQLSSELQVMLHSMHTDIQKGGQSSLSLRDFYGTNLFSCRGLA